jgi:hypothetical protein
VGQSLLAGCVGVDQAEARRGGVVGDRATEGGERSLEPLGPVPLALADARHRVERQRHAGIDGREEAFLLAAGEVLIEGRAGDAGQPQELRDRRLLVATLGDRDGGRRQQPFALVLRHQLRR